MIVVNIANATINVVMERSRGRADSIQFYTIKDRKEPLMARISELTINQGGIAGVRASGFDETTQFPTRLDGPVNFELEPRSETDPLENDFVRVEPQDPNGEYGPNVVFVYWKAPGDCVLNAMADADLTAGERIVVGTLPIKTVEFEATVIVFSTL